MTVRILDLFIAAIMLIFFAFPACDSDDDDDKPYSGEGTVTYEDWPVLPDESGAGPGRYGEAEFLPLSGARVEVVRVDGNKRLGKGRTDGNGRFRRYARNLPPYKLIQDKVSYDEYLLVAETRNDAL